MSHSPRIRPVPAVSRAAAVLRLLSRNEGPLGVQAIARTLDLVPSTCLHILRALAEEGLVTADPKTRRYTLDVGILALARGMLQRGGLIAVAQPRLDALARLHGVTAIAVKVTGLAHMTVIAISHAGQGLRLQVDVGSRFPALISATGRCLAAFSDHPAWAIETGFGRLRWHQAPSFALWREQVAQARRDGWAADYGNYIAGVTILAAPVLNREGHMTHGIVSVGVAEQTTPARCATIAATLRKIASDLTGIV